MPDRKQSGFTLIELSIVLVIIGLIVGGVLVGRDLIQAAALRSTMSQMEQYNTAVNAFRLKYNCIPGDCQNATQFLGQYSDCTVGQWTDYGLGNATCNGNGDGKITYTVDSPPINHWEYDETVLLWQQLSQTNLIKGKYTGVLEFGDTHVPNKNIPMTSIANGCISIDSRFINAINAETPYSDMHSNYYILGNAKTYNGTSATWKGCVSGLYSLPASSAKNIDDKMDDGKPFSGTIQTPITLYDGVWNNSGNTPPGCTNVTALNIPTATYASSVSSTACQLFIKAQF